LGLFLLEEVMNELALFAGVGGGILGGKLLGWKTVCAVEYNEHARNVLIARQNDRSLDPFPIWDDVRTFNGKPWRGIVDVVSGGFPCQDISVANAGAKGLDGERSGLWEEMRRIISEVRPRYAFVENSPALVRRGLGRILGDFTEMGYDAKWGIFSAADIGARHQRERLWIVAYPHEMGRKICSKQKSRRPLSWYRVDFVEPLQYATDPGSIRGNDELSSWMDRIARCGNGQVPGVVRLAFEMLTRI
jgi:DNA (cytosine-5)-methyltransferase 1